MKLSKNSFNFGEIPLTGVYNDSVIIEDSIEDFHCLGGSCFCVKVSKEGNKINLEFTPSKSIMDLKKGEKKTKPTFVYIYLEPDVRFYIVDEFGVRRDNPDKKRIVMPINFMAVG